MKSKTIDKIAYWTEKIINVLSVVIVTAGMIFMVYIVFTAIGNLP